MIASIVIGYLGTNIYQLIFMVFYITKTKLGCHIRAVGDSIEVSKKMGIDVDSTRRLSIVLSTALASLGHLMFVQNMGVVNVYTGYLKLDIFAAAALLAGGATFKKATVKNAFLGLILFHVLFIVSPLAGQNWFKNPALGEYFRSFIAYGTIVIALILNLKFDSEEKRVKNRNYIQKIWIKIINSLKRYNENVEFSE